MATEGATKSPKAAALELIGNMPDEVSTETIVAELQFQLLVQRRRQSAKAGNVLSHDEAKQKLSKWLPLSGK